MPIIREFPGCCTAKILCGFGGGDYAEHMGPFHEMDHRDVSSISRYIIDKCKGLEVMGDSALFIIASSTQEKLLEALDKISEESKYTVYSLSWLNSKKHPTKIIPHIIVIQGETDIKKDHGYFAKKEILKKYQPD